MRVNRGQRLKWTVPLVLLLSTIIDAALPAIFPSAFLGHGQTIISHITLYYIIVFAFYFRDSYIVTFSFIFGLFYDSYNTNILGVQAALYTLLAYVVVKLKPFFPKRLPVMSLIFFVAIVFVDWSVFIFYREIGQAPINLIQFMATRLSPTLIFNIVMAIILYFPTRSLLRWLGYEDYIIF